MSKVLTLEEITDAEPSVYGVKTAELVALRRILPKVQRRVDLPLAVPAGFGVPVGVELDHPDVKECYAKVTRDFSEPMIVSARSSDPDEMPGKFESYPSLFDPKNPETFQNWLKSAEKVRASGSRGILGMVFPVKSTHQWFGSAFKHNEPVYGFGGDSITGFVANSTNFVFNNRAVFSACWGLPSKIVRNDKDIVVACKTKSFINHTKFVGLDNNYNEELGGCIAKHQNTVDIITLENPDKITTFESDLFGNYLWNQGHIPFELDVLYRESDEGCHFRPSKLLDITEEICRLVQRDVELEGFIRYDSPALFFVQLRPYDCPKKNFTQLSKIDETKLILRSENSMGYNQFKGDLFVSDKLIKVPEDAIFCYIRNDLDTSIVDYPKLVYVQRDFSGHPMVGSHTFGYTLQQLLNFEERGVKAIALDSALNLVYHKEFLERVSSTDDYIKYKDVTVECVGEKSQIYFN